MYFKNEFWALIPARSKSNGLKHKNIKKIAGKHLIGYSLITAAKCKKINKVIFSSDSKKYIQIAKKYKCYEFHLRSKKNSTDNASEYSVFREYIDQKLKKKLPLPLYFLHFRPTTTIHNMKTINKTINYLKKKQKKK